MAPIKGKRTKTHWHAVLQSLITATKEYLVEIRNQKDFGAGLMYVVTGLFFTFIAARQSMYSAPKMGPWYFPFWLGLLLTALGLVVLVKSLQAKTALEKIPPFDWKIIGLITGSVVLYGVLLPIFGFGLAIMVLVFTSSKASHEFGWKGTLINALVLALGSYLIFVFGLKLQFPLLPYFLQ
ncbi:tripartite tricarboxylate transporter TctB family protein [Polynucleobacter sphagniphilus]|uniref:tripartite tricarboxylate transporter TctB family protein n=1 Tax=Polynucleobacter sphagniphilus TaxID=1743169 RepID=UPI001E3A4138|nr:tripartite tricarboxylate transporter TctB family protein [Polynucleobacter sphagniphilus]